MAEPVPDVEVSSYYLDTMVPLAVVAQPVEGVSRMSAVDTLSLYLLDLMAMQGYRVVSGVRVDLPTKESPVDYPEGWTALRLVVDAQEFDVGV